MEVLNLKALVACLLVAGCVSCGNGEVNTQPTPNKEVYSDFACLTHSEVERIEQGKASDEDVLRLAQHYGICLSDGDRQIRWLKVLVARGDSETMRELANIYEGSGGASPEEIDRLRRKADAADQKAASSSGASSNK